MSTRCTTPAQLAPGSTSKPTLWAPKVTVTSARTAGPGTAPVSGSMPLGRSTASTAPEADASASTSAAGPDRSAPDAPMPTIPSRIRSAASMIRCAAAATVGAAPGWSVNAGSAPPPAARNSASPVGWALAGSSRTARTTAPRLANRAPANSASPPLSPAPARRATRRPYACCPSSSMPAAASPAAARCMSVPGGRLAISSASARRIALTPYPNLIAARISALGDHDRTGDARVVAQRYVPGPDAELCGANGDGALDDQPGLAGSRGQDLAVVPAQAAGCAQRFGHRLLGGEPGGQRGRADMPLGLGEHARYQSRSALQRLHEALDVHHRD